MVKGVHTEVGREGEWEEVQKWSYMMCMYMLNQGPIVNDLGAMPVSDAAMPLVRFEQLLDSIPGLRVMTISPHVDARDGYQRIQALLKR